jgi:hypothetical protein
MASNAAGPPPNHEPTIVDLPGLANRLEGDDRERFSRLIRVTEATGHLRAPSSMHEWITKLFGSVQAVEEQTIVKTTNLVTMEGTLFNALRASRPFESGHSEEVDQVVSSGAGDPFCKPLEGTPEDVFGRVQGKRSLTASNVAKYDAFHGVVVFNEHNPLAFDQESISDAIDVGLEWGQRALQADPAAKYLFFLWNCLWKSGASILHGHAQVVATRDLHFAKVEGLRRQAAAYRVAHGASYFDDLVAAHRALGLVHDIGEAAILTNLTPIKEKEVLLIAPDVGADLRRAIWHVLDCFVHHLGVTSFNLVIYMPPLAPAAEDWSGFPRVVRIVDRGEATNKTADVGAMELYASSVVSSDPFRVAAALRQEGAR